MTAQKSASPANSEWLTRRKLIDPQLTAAGWQVVTFDPARPAFGKKLEHLVKRFNEAVAV